MVKINGVVVGRFCLTKPAMIKVNIPEVNSSNSIIKFEFYIDHPHVANEFNPKSNDGRSLGLGFVSLHLIQ